MSQIVNKFLAQAPTLTLKGNNTGGTANVKDLTTTQVNTMLGTITSLTGDVTGTGPGATATTLVATSNATLTTLSALTSATSLASVGTITTGTWNATTIAANHGGTGFSSYVIGDTLYANTTSTLTKLPIGTNGQVLTIVSGVPAWGAASSGTVTSASVVSANGFAGTVATATTTPAITISTTLTTPVLAGNGTALIAATTTGTGSTVVLSASPTITGTLSTAAISASGALNMNSNQINNVSTPLVSTDAANKGYVDAAINGLTWKGPVAAYANSNVPLTGGATLTIDGYSAKNGDLVILGAQATASQNGEYTVSGIGTAYTLTANGQPTAAGDAWLVLNGTVFANSAFVATSPVPTAAFVEFAGPTALIFNSPLSLTGNTVSLTLANNEIFVGNGSNVATAVAMSGDATIVASGAITLATVNANVGTFGSSTSIPTFTVNAKGLITAASGNAVVAPAGTLTGTTLASNVVTSSLTTVGTIGTGTWQGTAVGPTFGGTGQTSYATGDTLYASATNVLSKLTIGATGTILTVVGGVPTWAAPAATSTPNKQTITLGSGDITNQYVDLAFVALTNSILFMVAGAGSQFETVDYTVNYTGGVGGVTRIMFAGGLATAGNSALVAGDVLQIQYSH